MKNTGDGRRVGRVEQEVQKTIAQYLISGFRHPLQGLVTVSKVIMPGDLRTAKVYISVLGSEEQKESTLEVLRAKAGEVQKYVGDQLRMRYCPKLSFFPDHTTEQIMKIEQILGEIHSTQGSGEKNDSEDGN
jgi:ribosome-binding factor A